MNSKTHFCPRCKEDRLREWFGNPKAPYAICLRCRVEVNGEQKQSREKGRDSNCAICEVMILEKAELCKKCEAGLSCFDNKVKLLGRAVSYLSGKLRRPSARQKVKRRKAQNLKLQNLIRSQAQDLREQKIRFEHAVSKP